MKSRSLQATLPLAAFLVLAGLALATLAQGDFRAFAPVVLRNQISEGTPVVKINFQPGGTDIPSGYFPDTGAIYGVRGNSFTYGWNADNSATTRDRNSPLAADQRYDTLIHLQKPENPDAIWEIALAPGVYDVYAVAGDPEAFDGHMQSIAEGQLLLNGTPSEGHRFIPGTAASVSITDGRLTVRSGPSAVNNKLSFIEIYKLADLPGPTPQAGFELRGLWVTRFDWTQFNTPASPAKIDEIVANAADAGFNAIFLQVRGTADAFYTPGLEPWAERVSGGELGQAPSPYWDPLSYFVQRAHEHGLQLHAYLNVHPVWGCAAPPPMTSPTPLYYVLQSAHGTTGSKLNGLQWTTTGDVSCGAYLRASPASSTANNHFKAVVADLVTRYDIDGIHLDNVRYAGGNTSCDPVSAAAYGQPCFGFNGSVAYDDWQREQVSGLVRDVYEDVIVQAGRDIWLSAAVWPIYRDNWGWGVKDGFGYYYQDSQTWVQDGYIDSISPMIYPGVFDCPDQSFWTQSRWQTLVSDFQAHSGGRYIVPGIGTGYCTFGEIAGRIEMARSLGTAGHALFSYGELLNKGYFDDLKNGPYALPAVPPDISWHD